MRHIPISGKSPDAGWLAKSQLLLEALRKAPDESARHAIIDGNSAVWGELKQWLLSISHQKCWFSEAKDCFSHFDVEHYRPKKSARNLDGTERCGYWWLTFDWTNFRICGNAGNRKKGTFFPLRPGCASCPPLGDLRHEDALLLDPSDPNDPTLVSFNVEGRTVPTAGLLDEWEKERVEYSVVRYNLDFGPLMDKRKMVWAECWDRIQEYRNELTIYHNDKTNMVAKQGFTQALKRLRELMQEDRELSGVARACVRSTGDSRLQNILGDTDEISFKSLDATSCPRPFLTVTGNVRAFECEGVASRQENDQHEETRPASTI